MSSAGPRRMAISPAVLSFGMQATYGRVALQMLMCEAAQRTRLSCPVALQVVLVNNGGGGIFSFLPVAGEVPDDTFTALWATPQHVDLMGAQLRACACQDALVPSRVTWAHSSSQKCTLMS